MSHEYNENYFFFSVVDVIKDSSSKFPIKIANNKSRRIYYPTIFKLRKKKDAK